MVGETLSIGVRLTTFFIVFSVPTFADNQSLKAIKNKILEQIGAIDAGSLENLHASLCTEVKTPSNPSIAESTWNFAKNFVKGIDGITINGTVDVADLYKAIPKWIDVSGSIEFAVFVKDGKVKVGAYAVPQVGLQAGGRLKSSTGAKVSLTSGCGGEPSKYAGYFATGGVGGASFSFGLHDYTVGACLYEGFRLLTGRATTGEDPKSLNVVTGELSQIGTRIQDDLRELKLTGEDFLSPPWKRTINVLDPEEGTVNKPAQVGKVLADLRQFHGSQSERIASLAKRMRRTLEIMEEASKLKDPQALSVVNMELGSLYDDLMEYRKELADLVQPFTQRNWNPATLLSTVTTDVGPSLGRAGSTTREKWLKTLFQRKCRANPPPRFVKGGSQFFDCLEQEELSQAQYDTRKRSIVEAKKLVDHSQEQLDSMNDLWNLSSHAFSKFRAQLPVDRSKLRTGGNESDCKNPLTFCNSLTLPLVSIGPDRSIIWSAAEAMSKMHTALVSSPKSYLSNLKKISAGGSLSHYWKFFETEVPISKLGKIGNLLGAPCAERAVSGGAGSVPRRGGGQGSDRRPPSKRTH